MQRFLVTGGAGFIGSNVCRRLVAEDCSVRVLDNLLTGKKSNLAGILEKVEFVEGDMGDSEVARSAMCDIDVVLHFGALPSVPLSVDNPVPTHQHCVNATFNLLLAARDIGVKRFVYSASSSAYGDSPTMPKVETMPTSPLSPYAVSKVGQDLLAYQYFRSYGLKTIRTRGFNHTGPRRGEVFVTSNFAKQIASIEAGLREPVIRVGNLDAQRDFTDVRDMVRAYWLAVTKAKHGEVYNLASGKAVTIRELLDQLLALSETKVEVEVDPERLRPSDVEILLGDFSKFKADTGWEPSIPLRTTLADLLDDARRRVRPEAHHDRSGEPSPDGPREEPQP